MSRPCYSMISSTARFFSFVALALRMVRMARAVRRCLPMTLPTSGWATRSSMTVTFSPSTWLTFTLSGSSTKAFAICSTSSRIDFLLPHVLCLLRLAHVLQQTLDGVGRLRALGDPGLNLATVQLPHRRLAQGAVVSEDLE